MAHWEHRAESKWKSFKFNQPYAKGLQRLRDEVLGKTDFDPATLWQWGTMQAMALIEVLESCEKTFGAEGQRVVCESLRKIGLDVGRQVLAGIEIPADMTQAEFASFYATVLNRIAYASLEEARIEADGTATFDIVWCPHQDHYEAFDCRVQRYFVQGMLEAAKERAGDFGFDVRFDTTIPSGAKTCHFTMFPQREAWQETTRLIEEKALLRARRTG
jgi:hypothetical protein